MDESPDETALARAARAALLAELEHSRTTRKATFRPLPDEDQVIRLIAAAWPVLAGAGDGNG